MAGGWRGTEGGGTGRGENCRSRKRDGGVGTMRGIGRERKKKKRGGGREIDVERKREGRR